MLKKWETFPVPVGFIIGFTRSPINDRIMVIATWDSGLVRPSSLAGRSV